MPFYQTMHDRMSAKKAKPALCFARIAKAILGGVTQHYEQFPIKHYGQFSIKDQGVKRRRTASQAPRPSVPPTVSMTTSRT